ncbi:transposase [Xenorhabdus thuongxuanensis]|uniref:Transposase n=1 Tax=Xenorhabdus thuongxuanensis TaxID=1873484 RepID=A0A1Q5TTJ6_9GAMM|nr:transposase [Xenorhabdus thuongxuanensis]
MAMIEVKCLFCQRTEFVKKHGKGDVGHQRYAIVVYPANEPFNLSTPIAHARQELKNTSLILL